MKDNPANNSDQDLWALSFRVLGWMTLGMLVFFGLGGALFYALHYYGYLHRFNFMYLLFLQIVVCTSIQAALFIGPRRRFRVADLFGLLSLTALYIAALSPLSTTYPQMSWRMAWLIFPVLGFSVTADFYNRWVRRNLIRPGMNTISLNKRRIVRLPALWREHLITAGWFYAVSFLMAIAIGEGTVRALAILAALGIALGRHEHLLKKTIVIFYEAGVSLFGLKYHFKDCRFYLIETEAGVRLMGERIDKPEPTDPKLWPILPADCVAEVRTILAERQGEVEQAL